MLHLQVDKDMDRTEAPPEHKAPNLDPNPNAPLRIVQVLDGKTWGEITPGTIERGLGGRETALLQLSLNWAEQGHHVLNFVNIAHPYRQIFPGGGSLEMIDGRLAPHYLNSTYQDVVIGWEHTQLFSFQNIASNAQVKIIGMQVAHLDLDPESLPDIDAIIVLSDWARRFLITAAPFLEDARFYVIPNGVDLNKYPQYPHPSHPASKRRTSNRFFYSSSPDRGLHHLLRAWPKIQSHLPNAELYVAYGARRWTQDIKWAHYIQGHMALEIERLLNQPGIHDLGLIGQSHLARIQAESSLLPYPCDTMSPTETGCITVTEALAALCPVVTTDCDCLGEEYGAVASIVPLPYNEDHFLDAMFTILDNEDVYLDMQIHGREFAEGRSWNVTSTKWMTAMRELMAQTVLS